MQDYYGALDAEKIREGYPKKYFELLYEKNKLLRVKIFATAGSDSFITADNTKRGDDGEYKKQWSKRKPFDVIDYRYDPIGRLMSVQSRFWKTELKYGERFSAEYIMFDKANNELNRSGTIRLDNENRIIYEEHTTPTNTRSITTIRYAPGKKIIEIFDGGVMDEKYDFYLSNGDIIRSIFWRYENKKLELIDDWKQGDEIP